jgi:hypothetical protein
MVASALIKVSLKTKEPMEKINMGMGELANQSIVFVRKFRFTLSVEGLSELYIKKAKIDYVKKTLSFEAYEIFVDGKLPTTEWLKKPGKSAIFTTYDGSGNPIYCHKFNYLILTGAVTDFDMASSDESTLQVSMSFYDYEVIATAEKIDVDFPVREKRIDRLNSSTFIV